MKEAATAAAGTAAAAAAASAAGTAPTPTVAPTPTTEITTNLSPGGPGGKGGRNGASPSAVILHAMGLDWEPVHVRFWPAAVVDALLSVVDDGKALTLAEDQCLRPFVVGKGNDGCVPAPMGGGGGLFCSVLFCLVRSLVFLFV